MKQNHFSSWLSTIGEGTFSLQKGNVISGPFVFLRFSNVPRHHRSWLMDADGGSVWHYGHSSACFRGAGHVVCPNRPHSTPLMWPRPPSQLQGASGTVRSGGTECQFSPPVHTSQHALIPLSPKVTLSGLQLASQQNLPPLPTGLAFSKSLTWSSTLPLWPVWSLRAGFRGAVPARATWSLIVHCHRAGEEEIKTNMWWQEVPDKMNHCN